MPLIRRQYLIFVNGADTVVRLYPTDHEPIETASGRKVKALENIVTYIGVLTGSGGSVYSVSGWGGSNSGTEWFGYYSTDGTLLAYTYGSCFEYRRSSGSVEDVYSTYGIEYDRSFQFVRDHPYLHIEPCSPFQSEFCQ